MTSANLYTSAGVLVRIITIDDTTEAVVLQTATNGAVMDLELHGSRHSSTGADPIPAGGIAWSQVTTPSTGIPVSELAPNDLFVKAPAPTPGVSSAYGTAVVDTAPAIKGILPLAVAMTAGGTVGTSETVTIEIITTFSDATTATVTHAFTAVGTYQLTQAEVSTLTKDAVYITQTSVASMSSLTATTATTTVNITGIAV